GLWYAKDTAMALTAYTDVDHAGCQDTRRSTSGSAQFLGDKLLANIFTKALSRQRFEFILPRLDKMADVNAPSGQAPAMAPQVRTNDQILPRIRWVPIGKSNYNLDLEKSQGNPIYKITVDLLKNTNFFRAFTAPSTIPSIYIQQLWDTVQYDEKAGSYRCQLDEQWCHPRPDSPLHLPNEEPVLGYLKFNAKGTKREVFGMPIPGSLITEDIQEASYYQEYLANVAKHKRYLADEIGSDQNSPASKPTKPVRKPKSTAPKAPPRPSRLKIFLLFEHHVAAEDANFQKALEESMKTAYALPRGPLPPVVIREPESGKYQPLPEAPGKGKAKVTKEQVAHDLLSLQKPKKKSPVDQYIFLRRVSEPTGSFRHDESPYVMLGQSYSKEESEKVMLGTDEGGQGKGQAGPDPGWTRPCNAGADVHSIPSPVVHARSDREHIDLDVADVSPQAFMEQLDEGLLQRPIRRFKRISSLELKNSDKPLEADSDKATAETKVKSMVSVTIQQDMSSIPPLTSPIIDLTSRPESPKVHQQFKATITETTITTTTTTLPLPPAQQQIAIEAMMMKLIGELEHIMANLIQVNKYMEERLDKHGARLYTLEQLDIPQQVSKAISEVVMNAVDWAMQAPPRNRFRDLPEADMKEIIHQRMWETKSYKSHEDHTQLFEALEKSMNRDHSEKLAQDLAERDHPKLRELLELLDHPKCHHHLHLYPPIQKVCLKALLHQAYQRQLPQLNIKPGRRLTSDSDRELKARLVETFEEERPATPKLAWSIRSSDVPVPMNNWASALASNYSPPPEDLLLAQTGPAFEIIKVFHPDMIHLQYQMEECHKLLTNSVDDPILRHNVSKPLTLGGPPDQVTIQFNFFFNKDLKYLRYGSKGRIPALSISKIKAAYNPDAGLEQMVPDHVVRTHMWILSVVRIEVFSMYGYDYMKKIVLYCVDLNEHVIAEQDFKYLALMFWDKYGVQMMMRFNEIHKFSDGTLQQIDKALDYRVKEFRINRMNPRLNMRFWTRKDVDLSKAFMLAIQRCLKTKRIFRNLESFIGGRVREGGYRLLKRIIKEEAEAVGGGSLKDPVMGDGWTTGGGTLVELSVSTWFVIIFESYCTSSEEEREGCRTKGLAKVIPLHVVITLRSARGLGMVLLGSTP
nr:uncharacterized mitochondrial protein AtMg00810-like [Tanacetum cinerariifolium]